MVKSINALFEKYRNLTPPARHIKKAYQEVIEEMFAVVIPEKDITVQKHTVYLAASPALKSELFLRKNEALAKLHHKLDHSGTKTTVTDLR